jgi:hypothetical protein
MVVVCEIRGGGRSEWDIECRRSFCCDEHGVIWDSTWTGLYLGPVPVSGGLWRCRLPCIADVAHQTVMVMWLNSVLGVGWSRIGL